MAQVRHAVELTVPDDCTLAELEELIGEQLRETGRALLVEACAALEEKTLSDTAAAYKPNKRRARDLLTRFGWIRLLRWSAQERNSGQYRYLLDDALAIEPNQHASPWVKDQAATLAGLMSYREATSLLSRLLGVDVDHRTVWGWVQDALKPHRATSVVEPPSRTRPEPVRLPSSRASHGSSSGSMAEPARHLVILE